jgi:hypothetical protein
MFTVGLNEEDEIELLDQVCGAASKEGIRKA